MNMNPQVPKRDIIKVLKEDLTVESLFHELIVTGPEILSKVLRDYLVLNDFQYVPHPNTTIICYGLTNCLFDNAQDRTFAINALKEASKSDVSTSSSMHSNNRNYNNSTDEVKTERNIAQKFKQAKYGGKLGEGIERSFSDFETTVNDYKLSDSLKLQYLHNLFEEEPRHFYGSKVYTPVST